MKLFGCDASRYTQNLSRSHLYAWYFLKCFAIFRRPIEVIRCYVAQTLPDRRRVELRNGLVLHLSEDPYDIVTVFVVFVRQDYGRVLPGSVVVDVGANIGMFALYAAQSGAKAVYAYEPNVASFECLRRNIAVNHFEHAIFPHHLAVTGIDAQMVRFPRTPSVYNAILADSAEEDCDLVATITLASILERIETVDLLKVDCEGGEYEILFGADAGVFDRIQTIKLEYHKGRKDELAAILARRGFAQTRLQAWNERIGTAWFTKIGSGA